MEFSRSLSENREYITKPVISMPNTAISENDMDKFNPGEGEGKIPNIFFTLEPKEPQKYQINR